MSPMWSKLSSESEISREERPNSPKKLITSSDTGEITFLPASPLATTRPGLYLTCPTVYPLIYHSIADEIPETSRPLITRLFQLWLVLSATLLFNMVACIVNFAVGAKDSGSDLGSSIGYAPRVTYFICSPPFSLPARYFIFITPLSFLLWYR